MIGHSRRQHLHQPGAIGADHGHDKSRKHRSESADRFNSRNPVVSAFERSGPCPLTFPPLPREANHSVIL
jgi:hypothetical protein